MSKQVSSLKSARKARGMSVQAVAKATGLDASSISRIERGAQQPTPANAKRLAEVLGVPVLSILYPEAPADQLTAGSDQREAA